MSQRISPPRCSFCGKPEGQIRKLIAGPAGVFICDECVEEGYGVCKGCGNYAMLEDRYCEDCLEDGCYCDDDDEEDDGEY